MLSVMHCLADKRWGGATVCECEAISSHLETSGSQGETGGDGEVAQSATGKSLKVSCVHRMSKLYNCFHR